MAVEGFHVGANFYHAIGDRRADEGIATPVDADERIDGAGVILGNLADGRLGEDNLLRNRCGCKSQLRDICIE